MQGWPLQYYFFLLLCKTKKNLIYINKGSIKYDPLLYTITTIPSSHLKVIIVNPYSLYSLTMEEALSYILN